MELPPHPHCPRCHWRYTILAALRELATPWWRADTRCKQCGVFLGQRVRGYVARVFAGGLVIAAVLHATHYALVEALGHGSGREFRLWILRAESFAAVPLIVAWAWRGYRLVVIQPPAGRSRPTPWQSFGW